MCKLNDKSHVSPQVSLDSESKSDEWCLYFSCLQGAVACCRRKERKAVSDEESSEMDAEPSPSEEEAPGSLNITDEMKRMLNQL